MTTLSDLIKFSEERWPLADAAQWDNPGLAVGHHNQEVSKVLLAVDLTPHVLEEAIHGGFNLVFTHHPFIFKGLTSLSSQSSKGKLASEAIKADVAIYSAHTNADFSKLGVSETLAKVLGLSDLRFLSTNGEGVVGDIAPTTLLEFSRKVARVLPSCAQGIQVQGDPERVIQQVGLVAGAGDSYLTELAGLDLFITSDLRHHPASDHRDAVELHGGAALMNIPHFAAEWPWLNQAAAELKNQFRSVEFVVSEINTDPWTFAVMQ